MLVTVAGMLIIERDTQSENVPLPKVVTVEEIVAVRREEQPWKHLSPTLVTDDGMSIVRSPVPENAPFPNFVTDDGIIIDLRPLHQLKQKSLTAVNASGRVIDSRKL